MSKKSILEQALLQVEAFEEVVKQNSKGILASTMKQELNDLLKEALEDEESDDKTPDEVDDVADEEPADDSVTDEPENDETDDLDEPEDEETFDELPDDEEETQGEGSFDELPDEEDSEDTLDMTNASDGEVLKVFRAMKPEDGIVVKKDGNKLEFSVDDEDYIIKLDSDGEENLSEGFGFDDDDENSDLEPGIKDDEWNDLEDEDEDLGSENSEDEGEFDEAYSEEEECNTPAEQMYEITLDEDDDFDFGNDAETEGEFTEEISGKDPFVKGANKTRNQKSSLGGKTYQGKSGAVGDGNPFDKTANKSRNQKSALGGKTYQGKGGAVGDDDPFTKGSGKPRQGEFVEAARTKTNKHGDRPKDMHGRLGIKGKQLWAAGANLEEQVETLKKQNSEYRKALQLFKGKLNEVAVFNANLALATRLMTENTTTKQEKLNILKRFDSVSTITESKKLYGQIKTELEGKKPVTETVVNKITLAPSTSSSKDVLSESKVYENPQFKRIVELMGIKKK